MTCATCQHWKADESPPFGECQRIKSETMDVLEAEPAFVYSCDGCRQPLLTKPDFGCSLWEAR
jgi:hypothetical protein